MNLEPNRTVAELALDVPGATRVFERAGIDYCCGGQRSLADACATAGVSVTEMLNSLESAIPPDTPSQEPNFAAATLTEIMDHIVETHHVFTKNEIVRLRDLIAKVQAVHGDNHPELASIRASFQTLAAELEPHMMKEERVLFPYISGMAEAVSAEHAVSTPPFGTVGNPVRMMMLEHEGAGYLLKQMRQLSSNYTPPPDACISYQTLYQALDEFEKDLHQHIHLENNILFPRAVEMEAKIRRQD